MHYADLMKPDEDWRGLEDPSERRKIQNRIAQRAYRRNMREKANTIEQLKEQIRTYEMLHPHIAQDEYSTYQRRSSSPSTPPYNKLGGGDWYPPQQALPLPSTPSKERYPVSSPHDSQFSRMQEQKQQQVCPAAMEQQSAIIPRPATPQRMDGWASTNSNSTRTVTDLLAPVSSLPMEGGMKSVGIRPLNSADVSAPMYEDYMDDMADVISKSLQTTSLLHMAVAGNHIDTVKVLLRDERIMIDEEDSDGFTPLQRAVMHGRSEIVKLLLERNANTGPVRGCDL